MTDFSSFSVHDPHWGEVRILKVLPKAGDPWGVLAPLQGTPWECLITIVRGELLSYARYGHTMPLIEKLGPEPRLMAKKLKHDDTFCARHQDRQCQIRGDMCHVGSKDQPDCYVCPLVLENMMLPLYTMSQAIKENRYVVVLEGEEFVV